MTFKEMKDVLTFAMVRGAIVFFGGLAFSVLLYVTYKATGRCIEFLTPLISKPAACLVVVLAVTAAGVSVLFGIIVIANSDYSRTNGKVGGGK